MLADTDPVAVIAKTANAIPRIQYRMGRSVWFLFTFKPLKRYGLIFGY